jgi:hypothetical protein
MSNKGMGAAAHLGSARESSRIIVHVVLALEMANGKYTGHSVGRESPISNGLTTVAAPTNNQPGAV